MGPDLPCYRVLQAEGVCLIFAAASSATAEREVAQPAAEATDSAGLEVAVYVKEGTITLDQAQAQGGRSGCLTGGQGVILAGSTPALRYRLQPAARVVEIWSPLPRVAEPSRRYFDVADLPADELRPGTERRMFAVGSSALLFIVYDRPSVSPPHTHQHASILCVEEGQLNVTVEQEEHQLVPGDGVVVPAGVLHGLTTQSPRARLTELWHPFSV